MFVNFFMMVSNKIYLKFEENNIIHLIGYRVGPCNDSLWNTVLYKIFNMQKSI